MSETEIQEAEESNEEPIQETNEKTQQGTGQQLKQNESETKMAEQTDEEHSASLVSRRCDCRSYLVQSQKINK